MDEFEWNQLPKGSFWSTEPPVYDMVLFYGENSGKKSADEMVEAQKAHSELRVTTVSMPNVTKENFEFSADEVEKKIAR